MNTTSKSSRIIGIVLTTLITLFLMFDGAMKLVQPRFVIDATTRIGFPVHALVPIGVTLIVATLLYAMPMTSILGAVLLTGYLGGAIATQVYARSSAFETLFPGILGILVWISMLLRENRLHGLLPICTGSRRADSYPGNIQS